MIDIGGQKSSEVKDRHVPHVNVPRRRIEELDDWVSLHLAFEEVGEEAPGSVEAWGGVADWAVDLGWEDGIDREGRLGISHLLSSTSVRVRSWGAEGV